MEKLVVVDEDVKELKNHCFGEFGLKDVVITQMIAGLSIKGRTSGRCDYSQKMRRVIGRLVDHSNKEGNWVL